MSKAEDTNTSVTMNSDGKDTAVLATDPAAATDDNGCPQVDFPNEEAQRGVQAVEAVTLTWSKLTLIAIFLK